MVEFPASQRKQVSSLHGISVPGPSTYRDASNPRSAWKHNPTPITAPSNTRNNARLGVAASPYDYIGKNTLRRQSAPQVGNPNARATILTTQQRSRAQESKRSKPDHTFSKSSSSNPRSTNNTHTSSRYTGHPDAEVQIDNRPCGIESAPAHHRHPSDPEVHVISDGEDLGVPVPRHHTISSSPDPIALVERKHPFDLFPGDRQYPESRKGKGRDSSPIPQAHTVVVTDVDEIEEFTSEAVNDGRSPPWNLRSQRAAIRTPINIQHGHVAKTRKVFEPPNETFPLLDLRQQGALSGSTGVVKNMKPKAATKPASSTSQLQFDHISTSSTQFISTMLPRTKEPPLKLPLQAWAIGLKIFFAEEGSEPPVFEYDPKNGLVDVSVPGQSYSYQIQQTNGFEEVSVTNDTKAPLKDNVIIQLETRKDCEIRDPIREFEPGKNRLRGSLTFFFSTDEAKGWTSTAYQTLANFLKKSASTQKTVRPMGAKTIWEELQRHAEMFKQHKSRSSDARHDSLAPSIRDASPPPPPPALHSSTNTRTRLVSDTRPPNAEASSSLRRSSRRSAAAPPETLSESPLIADPEELILVYPPFGPGALNLLGSDLNRLRPHEYLNDTLIEFGLKLCLNELKVQNPDLAEQVHVFSSFFYKKLNNKSLDEGYQSVKKWTSKIDIFSKKYIIVPINENLHWYLAIIYEPEHTLLPPIPQKEPSLSQRGKLRGKAAAEPDVNPAAEAVPVPVDDISPPETRSESDAEAASLHANCASTPSVTQDEDMDDISPIDFTQSCSISNARPEKPRSASSSKPVSMRGRSASVGRASRRSMSIEAPAESILPTSSSHFEPMDVDVIDVDANLEGIESKDNNPSSNASSSTHVSGPPSALSSKPPSRSAGMSPIRFYGTSAVDKGKQKAVSVVSDSEEEDELNEDEKHEKEVDAMLDVLPSPASNNPLRTWIFTLDSLGSRHVQAQRVLKYWLKAEAQDKRQYDEVRTAEVKFAQVPSQPNFADCGIYLLHFAKTFLSNPVHYFDLMHQSKKIYPAKQRKLDWNEGAVQDYRQNLIAQIKILSTDWKASRVAKEEEAKRKRKSEELGQAESESSDADVDIVEDVKAPRPTPKQKERPAKRIRGGNIGSWASQRLG
ncbi:uncharacterized protein EDB91DRAFT_1119149 [Suillus paluster]|uniref:uncharacterized protein n=1 Tax=Suillus paluster TaxID=48578 RepID=UPI001B87F9AE|nr:uncharacterized protein EDB91DRAFT_1119149 [Suillus paluster]KAG1745863.1 hypothetical protein EDB91DRAFT_1119149 [Suillus paluster]